MTARARRGPASDVGEWLTTFVREESFLERYPYYVALLARMDAVADPSVQRMAVSTNAGRFYLHVNVESFVEHPEYLRGVLLHEVHHVALGHLTHPKFADPEEPDLMELAVEMSANEHIEEPLPDPIVWKAYAALGIRARQSTMERYERLREAKKKGARIPGGREVDDHRLLRRAPRDAGTVEHTRQLLVNAAADVGAAPGDDASTVVCAGTSPGRLVEELTGVTGPAERFVDWPAALRMFMARARAPVHTYARPSRRFPERVGELPGRIWSPRVITRPSLLVAIDTSMSMRSDELAEIARHLAPIAERARVTIVECDTEIARVRPFDGALRDVRGRGGTDLRPVFDPSFLGAQRPDGVVYFTDGMGPFPEAAPPVPTLWVLTKPARFACPWGERAELRRPSARR
jgi:predicted metal-dependent peptidase